MEQNKALRIGICILKKITSSTIVCNCLYLIFVLLVLPSCSCKTIIYTGSKNHGNIGELIEKSKSTKVNTNCQQIVPMSK